MSICRVVYETVEGITFKAYVWFGKWVYVSKRPYHCGKPMKRVRP